MKKLLSILFAILYAVTSTGATVYTHYCMGEIVQVALHEHQGDSCENCGMDKEESDGCCKDELTILKAGEHKLGVEDIVPPILLVATLPENTSFYYKENTTTRIIEPRIHCNVSLPYNIPKSCPEYIFIRNLRI